MQFGSIWTNLYQFVGDWNRVTTEMQKAASMASAIFSTICANFLAVYAQNLLCNLNN